MDWERTRAKYSDEAMARRLLEQATTPSYLEIGRQTLTKGPPVMLNIGVVATEGKRRVKRRTDR